MDDKEFVNEYRHTFDKITASDELRRAVMDIKPQKKRYAITPLKATISTVAAAVMIFCAVNEYKFEKNTDGVISETVVSTQLPDAEFQIVEKKAPENSHVPTQHTAITVTAQPRPTPVPTTAPIQASADPTVLPTTTPDNEPVALSDEGVGISPRGFGGGGGIMTPTIDVWTVNQYYDYIGVDIGARLGARYTGTQLELEVDADGIPVNDIMVLPYLTNSGASIRVTLSKSALFNASASGIVEPVGDGFNGYKVSGGVYYNVYGTNITEADMREIINML